jgi:hypothetical protein
MKKVILSTISFLCIGIFAQAQTTSNTNPKIDLTGRPADHFMIQFGSTSWTNKPDSIQTSGMGRHFNLYFMYDKPFKKNPKYSVAYGAGIGTNNIYFDGKKTYVNIKSSGTTLPFQRLDSTANHFAKQKITTVYFQAPVELRYFSDPAHPGKSWKMAAGLKVGTMVKAYSKAKNYVNSGGYSLYGKTYKETQQDSRFFGATDLTLTGRVGYGIISFDMGYQITGVLRDGYGPVMNKLSLGLTISGL